MLRVRAEIIGEFVNARNFESLEKACAWYEELQESGIYDSIEIFEIDKEV